ncbi:MAG: NAD(P)/FAD-dependent oxidoreductase [Clostridia bacterium]|nr:NAD(P)/FAD-dependent oxidoreductase [Clostridia bacterium]
MKKILVAGAGHGGLVAAAILAKQGYDVTVYEAKKKEDLGHDWEDRFTFSLLEKIVGKEIPRVFWRYRGDCAFVSPSFQTKVIVRYDENSRQKMMWRKPLIGMLLQSAEESGVKFLFETKILSPMIENGKVVGLVTTAGEIRGDLVIDACGVHSPVRMNLPDSFGIEKAPRYGDVFYAYRAYFDKACEEETDTPFEVFLCHEGEQGLSWHLITEDSVDVLIGRVYPLSGEKVKQELERFRDRHPSTGTKVLHGGNYGIIPVRRPLPVLVANGYAAVGDSAFMTTPMNGMGIDLSLQAGLLLAETAQRCNDFSAEELWEYNKAYHKNLGGEVAKNEGLKNALLSLTKGGVDFLFESAVIQASDLAGAGRNTDLKNLLGKFVRGMKKPKFFFAILRGLIKGGKMSALYKKIPDRYDPEKIKIWINKIDRTVLRVPVSEVPITPQAE